MMLEKVTLIIGTLVMLVAVLFGLLAVVGSLL
jgi:hypothetical protein